MLKLLFPSLMLLSSCALTKTASTHTTYSTLTPIEGIRLNITTLEPVRETEQVEKVKRELAGQKVVEKKSTEKTEEIFLKPVKGKKYQFWVEYFSKKDKERFERFINNGLKYKDIIEETFADFGLPKDLFYVGLIESGYYLGARSHAGAVGPWQFIKETGRRYGLTVNSRVDERRNIHKATQAAAKYFQDLYNLFGNWELALSAYNAGENGLSRRIRTHRIDNYYELSRKKIIPAETREYVPKVLAALEVMKNPTRYGIKIPTNVANPFANTTEVLINKNVSLTEIARAKGLSVSQLRLLNPDLKTNTVPYIYRKGFSLRVPNGDYQFIAKLPESPQEKATHLERHVVSRGENLISIANRYEVTLSSLMKENGLKMGSTIYVGQKLKLPAGNQPNQTVNYVVKSGDNLYRLAREHNTSVSRLVNLNNLKSRNLLVGQKIQLPAVEKTYHVVRRGEHLGKIAKRYGTSVAQIKRINQIKRNTIYAGQKLLVRAN